MIYAYKCCVCETVQDVDYPIGEAPASALLDCFKCHSWEEHRRIYTVPKVHFYGPGFYSTENSKNPLMKIPRKQRI